MDNAYNNNESFVENLRNAIGSTDFGDSNFGSYNFKERTYDNDFNAYNSALEDLNSTVEDKKKKDLQNRLRIASYIATLPISGTADVIKGLLNGLAGDPQYSEIGSYYDEYTDEEGADGISTAKDKVQKEYSDAMRRNKNNTINNIFGDHYAVDKLAENGKMVLDDGSIADIDYSYYGERAKSGDNLSNIFGTRGWAAVKEEARRRGY